MNIATIKNNPIPDYAGQESLNSICGNITFSGKNIKKIVITSVMAGAGKSYLSLQIALNLGRRGNKVLLIDADLRRSNMAKRYGISFNSERGYGLAHLLAGRCRLEDALYRLERCAGVDLIPSGRNVSDPIPLLNSQDFKLLLNEMSGNYDYVIVDSPPIGLVFDSAEIAKNSDGCILVAEYNETRRRDMLNAKKQMEASGCRILGYIINKVTFDTLSSKQYYNKSYYNHYGYGYYRDDSDQEKNKTKSK